MRVIIGALVFMVGCSSAVAERNPQANCNPDYQLMARGVVSCEELGDECAYSRDETTAEATLTKLGAADTYYLCSCGGFGESQIRLYWCRQSA